MHVRHPLLIFILSVCVTPAAVAGLVTVNANVVADGVTLDGTTQLGATPVDPNGSAWNDLGADVSSVDLKDSTGASTGIGVTMTSNGGNGLPNFTFSNPSGGVDAAGPDVLDGYWVATNNFGPLLGAVGFEFTGLDPSATYNIFFVTQGDQVGQGAEITLSGVTAAATGSSPAGPLAEGDNYISFLGVSPSTSTLAWTFDVTPGGSQNFAALNGFQIQVVPEPAVAWILAPWAATAWLAKRRRTNG